MSTTPLPTIRIRLPTEGEHDFMERHGATVGISGIFVPSLNLRPIGTRVRLIVEMKDGKVGLSGEAEIAEHAKPGARPGMKVRMVTLDPGSFPVRLDPSAVVKPGVSTSPTTVGPVPEMAAPSVPLTATPTRAADNTSEPLPASDVHAPVSSTPSAPPEKAAETEPAPSTPPVSEAAAPSVDTAKAPDSLPSDDLGAPAARDQSEITRRRDLEILAKRSLISGLGREAEDEEAVAPAASAEEEDSPLNPSDLERTQFETAENVQAAIAAMREEASRRLHEDTKSIPKVAVVQEVRQDVLDEPLKSAEKTRPGRGQTGHAPEQPDTSPDEDAPEDVVPQLSQEHPTSAGDDEPVDESVKGSELLNEHSAQALSSEQGSAVSRGAAERAEERLDNARALWALLVVLLVGCVVVLWALTRS